MKTRREQLIEAGVPADELALVGGSADKDLDGQCGGHPAVDLTAGIDWWLTPQGEKYWSDWDDWLDGHASAKPGPSGCVPATLTPDEAEALRYGETPPDDVDHPSHYTQSTLECIDAIEAACEDKPGPEAALVAPIIKYLWRYRAKGGLKSLRKARWYLDRLIERVESAV